MKNIITKYLLTLFVAIVTVLALTGAQSSSPGSWQWVFNRISLTEGLPRNKITALTQDTQGTFWIGTPEGACRLLNGHVEPLHSLFDGEVGRCMAGQINDFVQDTCSGLYILTSKGTIRHNPSDDTFTFITYNGNTFASFCGITTNNGTLIGSYDALYIIDKNGDIELYYSMDDRESARINAICRIDDHRIVFSHSGKGLFALDTSDRSIIPIDLGSTNFKPNTLFASSDHKLWVGDNNQGIRVFDTDNLFQPCGRFTVDNSALNNNKVYNFEEYNGMIWIATDGGGINIFDPADGSIRQFETICNGRLPQYLQSTVVMLYRDSLDNMWVGTVRGGLFEIKRSLFHFYSTDESDTESLSFQTVLAIVADSTNNCLWVGTDGGGVDRLNPDNGKVKHFQSLRGKKIMSLADYSADRLVVAIFGGGLFWFDKNSGELSTIPIADNEVRTFTADTKHDVPVCVTADGNIGLMGDLQWLLNPRDGSLTKLHYAQEGCYSQHLNIIRSSNTSNWIYVYGNRYICKVDSRTMECHKMYRNPNTIWAATIAPDNTVWIADDECLRHIDNNSATTFAWPFPLRVKAMRFDRSGRLWLGALNHVFCFDQADNGFHFFNHSDGVIPNEYYCQAVAITDNKIFMGGAAGLIAINSNLHTSNHEQPRVELISVRNNKSAVVLDADPALRKVKLPWNNSSLTIHSSVGNADVLSNNLLRFTIVGSSGTSTITSSSGRLSLTSLAPDQYSVMASVLTREGTWTPDRLLLSIDVGSPWWKEWWFYTTLILLIIGTAVFFTQHRLRVRRRHMEMAYNRDQKLLAEEKVRFLINMSHELRTPLTLIYAPLMKLLRERPDDNELHERIERVIVHTKNMAKTVNMVLDVDKIEAGNLELSIVAHPLNDWLKTIVSGFEDEFEARSMSIDFQPDPQCTDADFDSDKCQAVVSNFLMNAAKYSTNKGTIIVSSYLDLSNNTVTVTVSDQGTGIKESEMERIFDYRYQTNTRNAGNGIGLAYSKILIELHGGTTGCKNNDRGGANFYYTIPVKSSLVINPSSTNNDQTAIDNNILGEEASIKSQDEAIDSAITFVNIPNQPTDGQRLDMSNFTILLADDNSELLAYLKTSLTPLFNRVLTAYDGLSALNIMKQSPPDVVVSDVLMPNMDGFELCGAIKSDLNISHIPVILLTSLTDQQSTATGYKRGADVYVNKPFDTDHLADIISNLLRTREAVRQRFAQLNIGFDTTQWTFSNADEEFMKRLNEIVSVNMADPHFDADQLIEAMNMGRTTFYTKMKELTGLGAKSYINKLRIDKAVDLLTGSDKRVGEIATAVGYYEVAYFSMVFKKCTGLSPSQYRKQQLSGNNDPTE